MSSTINPLNQKHKVTTMTGKITPRTCFGCKALLVRVRPKCERGFPLQVTYNTTNKEPMKIRCTYENACKEKVPTFKFRDELLKKETYFTNTRAKLDYLKNR